jgi:site-specific DNA-methyltransferase (adenine-specific)
MKTIEDEMAELPLFKAATKLVIEADPHTPLERLAAGARFAIDQADAFATLAALPAGSVDMLNFDLPYESLEKHRAWGTTTRLSHSKKSSNDWFGVVKNERFMDLFAECHRVLAKNAHLYAWCDDETSDFMKLAAQAAGFKVWKRLVWDKKAIGMGYHYRARYEFILFMEKGKRRLADLGMPDVLEAKRIKHKDAYPAEKPVEINEIFTRQSTAPGELVCDPFMGSGSAGVAALKNGRKFLGSDVSPKAVLHARRRLDAV